MIYAIKTTKHKDRKPMRHIDHRDWSKRRPSGHQYYVLQNVLRLLRDTKDRRKEYQYEKLREEFALDVHDRRIYKSGGVGTYSWMPKLKCYRVQVGASHISTKCHCYPYAMCVEIYDVL